MNEREFKGNGIVVGVGLLGLLILNGVYQAGFSAGLARGGNPAAIAHDGGFFPFPPFLLFVGGVALFIAWRRRWIGNGHGPIGRGRGGARPPRLFEEWHRQAHGSGEAAPTTNPTNTAPSPAPEGQRPPGGATETTIV